MKTKKIVVTIPEDFDVTSAYAMFVIACSGTKDSCKDNDDEYAKWNDYTRFFLGKMNKSVFRRKKK